METNTKDTCGCDGYELCAYHAKQYELTKAAYTGRALPWSITPYVIDEIRASRIAKAQG